MSTAQDSLPLEQQLEQIRQDFARLRKDLAQAVVVAEEAIDAVLTALLSGGHVLVEGVPGVGKSLLAHTLARALGAEFRRIQFTPDLMPADVIGTYIILEEQGRRRFEFQQGPIFANVVLADEVNRSTPKTQSALIEALGEGAVTVANRTYPLPQPFFAIATQNQTETEGTFPLPQTQLDRFFFNIRLTFPSAEQLDAILQRSTERHLQTVEKRFDTRRVLQMRETLLAMPVPPEVRAHAVALLLATHPDHPSAPPQVRQFVAQGCGPRAAQALVLAGKVRAAAAGRGTVVREDLHPFVLPAMRHRLALNFEGHAEGAAVDAILQEVVAAVSAKTGRKAAAAG